MSRIVNILIAEDEPAIRIGIKKMVEEYFSHNNSMSCEIIEARDGRDAFRKCLSNAPDILITDIRMPGINGISLIKRLIQENICKHILVVSGYQDFKYVRDALRFGTHDYLLKPIKKKQLWEALLHFTSNFTPLKPVSLSTLYSEQRVIEWLFLREETASNVYEDFLTARAIDESLSCDVFFIQNDLLGKNREFELYYEIRQFCGHFPNVTVIQGELNFWIAIAVYKTGMRDDFPKSLEEYLVTAGYSVSYCHSLTELSEVYELNTRLIETFYDVNAGNCIPPDIASCIEQAGILVLSGEEDSALTKSINTLFERYQLDRVTPEQIRNDIRGLLYRLMALDSGVIEMVNKARVANQDLIENMMRARTLSGLRSATIDSLVHLHEQIKERQKTAGDATVNKAIQYMEENFANDIQLTHVSNSVYLHPNYLSALFKQNTGQTFSEYLRKLRIEHAKKMIRETDLSVNEIAEKSGFGNEAHFFRVFKSMVGVTPKKYKQRCAAGGKQQE